MNVVAVILLRLDAIFYSHYDTYFKRDLLSLPLFYLVSGGMWLDNHLIKVNGIKMELIITASKNI